MAEKEKTDESIVGLNPQHSLFILEECDLKPRFKLGVWYRAQVEAGQIWQIYRDGVQYDQLQAGPHVLWNSLWHRWKALRINLRIVHLSFTFSGRVKGPALPREAQSSAGMDLGCTVTSKLELSCKIANIETFLQYEDPLSTFNASLRNMVIEMIGRLPYDQFGDWATTLRDAIRERLQGGRNDTERLIGMRVEEIYVTDIKPDTMQDRSMIAMYQQVERVRREMAEAQANRQRDTEVARSFAEQGGILDIAPSILALQNSPIGKELIARDADLRKMMVAAGLNPGVSVQPLRDPQGQINAAQPSAGYLNLPRPASQSTGSVAGSMSFNTGPQNTGGWSGPLTPPQATTSGPLIDNEKQDREIAALQAAGFQCAGRGQHSPLFDGNGQPIPGSMEWVLEVYMERVNGFVTVVFHCPSGYPDVPPRVQVRAPGPGSSLKAIIPNAVASWNARSMLVDIVREIDNNTP